MCRLVLHTLPCDTYTTAPHSTPSQISFSTTHLLKAVNVRLGENRGERIEGMGGRWYAMNRAGEREGRQREEKREQRTEVAIWSGR